MSHQNARTLILGDIKNKRKKCHTKMIHARNKGDINPDCMWQINTNGGMKNVQFWKELGDRNDFFFDVSRRR